MKDAEDGSYLSLSAFIYFEDRKIIRVLTTPSGQTKYKAYLAKLIPDPSLVINEKAGNEGLGSFTTDSHGCHNVADRFEACLAFD